MSAPPPRIAVLIPCRNEAAAIASVVAGFRAALPEAAIHVYDNNSTDGTAALAAAAGALVAHEGLQGKGHVVRRMFADIEADIYLLVDGDGTYDPAAAPAMVQRLLAERLDMVTAARRWVGPAAWRRGHRFGNRLLSGAVSRLFGRPVGDLLSGYRAFSRRFVKSFPALATGFETETEFTIHALTLAMPMAELSAAYGDRVEGSGSKLRTLADGARIGATILLLLKEERPLALFAATGAALFVLGFGLAVPIFLTYARTGLVPRLPTAVLSTGLVLLSFLSLACGLILDSVARGRREAKRMAYLRIPPPG
ncbi:MAG: glycosyltransferase [Acetobacteraceae bacterium]